MIARAILSRTGQRKLAARQGFLRPAGTAWGAIISTGCAALHPWLHSVRPAGAEIHAVDYATHTPGYRRPIQGFDSPRGLTPTMQNSSHRLTQLQPFNEYRFDDCMAYLSARHHRPLAVYEIMKLHVMIDVYHTLDCGKPVIGGTIWPFRNGPVSRSSKSRISGWQHKYERDGRMPDGFSITDDGNRLTFTPTRVPEQDDFSDAEISAMDRAWKDVVELLDKQGFAASQAFFHRDSFVGQAWEKAKHCGQNLDWNDIVDEYDRAHPGEDHSRLKALLRF